MELIKYKSIAENIYEEYEADSNSVNHDATNFRPYDGLFNFLFAPYWVQHIENDTCYYYDCKYYESGVVLTWIDRYPKIKGSSIEGLIDHISEYDNQQIITPKDSNSLLLRESEINEGYPVAHWRLATQSDNDYIVLNLSHYPMRPNEMPEEIYDRYLSCIDEIIHEIDYMLVHAKIEKH